MGCNSSARLLFELQTAKQDQEELRQSVKLANDLKDAFQLEVSKAKTAVLTLTADNEKLAYELHIQKNSDIKANSQIFESTKEEFMKMKEWSEMEIKRANDILASLLANSFLLESDPKRIQIRQILEEIQESEYDPDKLLELGRQRFQHIETFVLENADFKNKVLIQLKGLEQALVVAAGKCEGKEKIADKVALISSKMTDPVIQTPARLSAMRDIIKASGLGGRVDQLMDDDRQNLEAKIEELSATVQTQAATIKSLQETAARTSEGGLHHRISSLEQELSEAVSKLHERTSESSIVRMKSEEMHDQIRLLQSRLKVVEETSAVGNDTEVLRNMLATLTATGEKLTLEADNMNQELEETKEKLRSYQKKIQAAKEILAEMKEKEKSENVLKLSALFEDVPAEIQARQPLFSFAAEI